MKRVLTLLVIGAQVAVLAWMAGDREWILHHGQSVQLRTAPVDPRDPMRGDYIRFDYEAAHIPKALCHDGAAAFFAPRSGPGQNTDSPRDQIVYVTVRPDEGGLAEVSLVSDRRPDSGPFLRARVVGVSAETLHVRYGAEAKFTEQGAAQAFQNLAQTRVGVPVDAELAVGGDGTAVLRDYRWEPLGITVQTDRAHDGSAPVRSGRRTQSRLTGITVELKNHSDHPVAIVVRPAGGSFRLVHNPRAGEPHYNWVGEGQPLPPAEPAMVRLLPPGGSYCEHLDLSDPRWFFRDLAKPTSSALPLCDLDAPPSCRVEYAPHGRNESRDLPNAALIFHARLRSRPFVGGFD